MAYEFHQTEGAPIKAWTRGVAVEDQAKAQLANVASMPFIHKHVAAMPDVHWGMGATVGSVIATKGAIIPAAVGVDIGCGMMAVRTTLRAERLPDNLHGVRAAIEAAVPHGRTNNGRAGDRGAWGEELPGGHADRWSALKGGYEAIIAKQPKALAYNTWNHMGTLGTGNHFIEVCLDEDGFVWAMLQSAKAVISKLEEMGWRSGERAVSSASEMPASRDLVEAAQRVVNAKDAMEQVRHLDPVDDVTAVAAARSEASESVEAMRQALQEIRSGK